MNKHIKNSLLLLGLQAGMFATAFAQEVTYQEPVKLSQALNSEAEEGQPILADDGTQLFFIRSFHEQNTGGKFSGHDIWSSIRLDNGEWSQAEKLSRKLSNSLNNAVVGINTEGTRIYLMDTYHALKGGERGISYSDKVNTTWAKPKSYGIKGLETASGFIGFYMHPSEKVLIVSMENQLSKGKEDLYVCLKNEEGEWESPVHLGDVINSAGFEIAPFLSEDERTLYFTSDGFGGLGDADIFKAERQDDSWTNWSAPENLGTPINSASFDGYYFHSKENEVFFTSNRNSKFSDIYTTLREVEKPEEVLMASVETKIEVAEEVIEAPAPEPTADEVFTAAFQTVVVYFDFDSHELSDEAKASLNQLIGQFKPTENVQLIVTGHTDQTGPEAYNQLLSEKRAKSVADFLQAKGISTEKLKPAAKGESNPVIAQPKLQERKQNRRVEITID